MGTDENKDGNDNDKDDKDQWCGAKPRSSKTDVFTRC